jgi:hypothetical protein
MFYSSFKYIIIIIEKPKKEKKENNNILITYAETNHESIYRSHGKE